jgi:hypothetical protein
MTLPTGSYERGARRSWFVRGRAPAAWLPISWRVSSLRAHQLSGRVRGGSEKRMVQPSTAEHGRGHLTRSYGAACSCGRLLSYARRAVRSQPTTEGRTEWRGFCSRSRGQTARRLSRRRLVARWRTGRRARRFTSATGRCGLLPCAMTTPTDRRCSLLRSVSPKPRTHLSERGNRAAYSLIWDPGGPDVPGPTRPPGSRRGRMSH